MRLKLPKIIDLEVLVLAPAAVGILMLLNYFLLGTKTLSILLYPGMLAAQLLAGISSPLTQDFLVLLVCFLVNTASYIAVGSAVLYAWRLTVRSQAEKPSNVPRIQGMATILVPLVLILSGVGLLTHRNHRMMQLYRTAIQGGTSQADAALLQLARFHGRLTSDLLLRLASPEFAHLDDRQAVAINLLAKRNDPSVAQQLAQSIRPYSSLALRSEISEALSQMECNSACSRSILHYLERRSCGEPDIEDLGGNPHGDPTIRDSNLTIKAMQDQLVQTLRHVLWKDQKASIQVLVEEYGLGTDYPSRFGLQIIGEAQLRGACALLRKSRAITFDPTTRGNLDAVIKQLQCPSAQNSESRWGIG